MSEAWSATLDDLLLPAHVIHDGARIVDLSPDLARMFGYDTAEEMAGRALLDFIDPSYHDRAVREILGGGESEVHDSMGVRKGGATFAVQVSAQPIRYRGAQARLALVRDLSPVALVVDDESVIRKMTAALLGRMGYRTLLAGSAEDGMDAFKPGSLRWW